MCVLVHKVQCSKINHSPFFSKHTFVCSLQSLEIHVLCKIYCSFRKMDAAAEKCSWRETGNHLPGWRSLLLRGPDWWAEWTLSYFGQLPHLIIKIWGKEGRWAANILWNWNRGWGCTLRREGKNVYVSVVMNAQIKSCRLKVVFHLVCFCCVMCRTADSLRFWKQWHHSRGLRAH